MTSTFAENVITYYRLISCQLTVRIISKGYNIYLQSEIKITKRPAPVTLPGNNNRPAELIHLISRATSDVISAFEIDKVVCHLTISCSFIMNKLY